MALGISVIVPFLDMTKQFAGNIGQVSHQINAVVMGLAGAQRIFALVDEQPEADDGYVTLVNAREENGVLTECSEHTGVWPGSIRIRLTEASHTQSWQAMCGCLTSISGYEPDKTVLHDISLYAEPGQKVAFVGATGAGKTTITNLLNRFYDIADGKIRYDGININKIKKGAICAVRSELCLQDTNLFTGTVMDNIRYGNLIRKRRRLHPRRKAGRCGRLYRPPAGRLRNDA